MRGEIQLKKIRLVSMLKYQYKKLPINRSIRTHQTYKDASNIESHAIAQEGNIPSDRTQNKCELLALFYPFIRVKNFTIQEIVKITPHKYFTQSGQAVNKRYFIERNQIVETSIKVP